MSSGVSSLTRGDLHRDPGSFGLTETLLKGANLNWDLASPLHSELGAVVKCTAFYRPLSIVSLKALMCKRFAPVRLRRERLPFGWRNQLIVAHRVAIGWLCNREPWIVPVGGRWSTKANLRIPLFAAELRPSICSIGDMRKRRLIMADRRPRHCCLGSPNSAFASARLGARLA